MNWSNTVLTEQLGIRYPIIQAPMAGGPGTPQLAAAVSNAGGLGSLAGGYLQPESLRQAIAEVRALTDRPFAVNLAVSAPAKVDPAQMTRAHELLAPYRAELGLPPEPPALPEPPEFEEQLDVVLEEGVAALSFIFGVPDLVYLELLREAGIVTLGTATHLLEAIVLEESGVDFIIAQGAEAGGHRGTFIGHPEQGLVGILALAPLLSKHIAVPIIAAGGIMDGRGIAAARVLGAAGVQMGTAFLTCPESGAHPAYKALLREGSEIATTLSRVFTGRFGRVLRNRLSDGLRSHEAELPGFPSQLFLTQDLRQAAAERNRTDFMALWAGQGCHLCEERPAAELIATWVGQATVLLGEGDAVEMIEPASAANDPDSTDSDSTDPDSTDPVQ
ncbi:NAD(P)H-dependent flavin oxidoreductase [Candidatus Contendibacter odensensis]|uniref:Nitronate monooxygenase n=1 Tax=Candidatus Contendobacter odensis Run_B_J11 TaxID=1400861 RepID=A0A7U7G7H5_9GAMM|nr:nitronate monooxygenase [Candidatus Contendobacter odensis]CDH43196.1 putative nitronate monooxygenase [Candidatus Contendobacter odensis Run_B_J11]